MSKEPAFPLSRDMATSPVTDMGGRDISSGMTKRELIAMHALAGMITGYAIAYGSPTNAPNEVAREAVNMADALLAALGEQS